MCSQECDYTSRGSLHAQFELQAKATPNAVAVVDEKGISHTYQELDAESTALAAVLKSRGLKKNCPTAIYMERSFEFVVAQIGILKAGGAYLPLDVSYPFHLIEEIVDEAQPIAIITKNTSFKFPSQALQKLVLNIEKNWFQNYKDNDLNFDAVPEEVCLDDLAFVAYSSGTTGKPKGVLTNHRGAVFSYGWRHDYYPYEGTEHEACNIFFSWEILRPLLRGQVMHVIPDETIYDPKRLLHFLKDRSITRMLFTPSLLKITLEVMTDPTAFASMKQIWLNGEVVTTSLLSQCVQQIPHVRIINLYSISECFDVAALDLSEYHRRSPADVKNRNFCPVGNVLPEVKVMILSEDLKVKPVGFPGEIYIGGPALARGYLNRPEIDRVRFINAPPDLKRAGVIRLHRTGDWGYLLSEDSLEICGRCDSMVKIRGYSVELQAIEEFLLQMDSVNACVVIAEGEEGEDKFLVAYIVRNGSSTRKEIREELKKHVPFYMIPSYFIFLNEIPLLAASGKVNKKALPPLNKEDATVEAEVLAGTPTELRLSNIWMKVLELSAIDIHESFFDLGGHSLLATRLVNLINDTFHLNMAVKDLFAHNTVSSMAKFIEFQSWSQPKDEIDLIQEVINNDLTENPRMDVQLRTFWRHVHWFKNYWRNCCIFLTGATGYVGSHILVELLLKTNTSVVCMVRNKKSGVAPKERLMMALENIGLSSNEKKEKRDKLQKAFNTRVTLMTGDISLKRFGHNQDDYNFLSSEIDCIIHVAADVNLIFPYQAVFKSNVIGTKNILEFAAYSKVKPVHHISTGAVFPHGLFGCEEDDDITQYAQSITYGYAQTKWVAEQLVQKAIDRGFPAVIYRLGNMSGNSITGFWNPADFNFLMIQAIVHTGLAPNVDWAIEMTPVDQASQLIVELMENLDVSVNRKFHVINEKTMPLPNFVSWLNENGYPTEMVNYKTWLQRLSDSTTYHDKEKIVRLLEGLAEDKDYFYHLSAFSNTNLVSFMNDFLQMKYPELDSNLLKFYFTKLAEKGLIPQPMKT